MSRALRRAQAAGHVVGFLVKVQYSEVDEKTKVSTIHRKQVSRVFHVRSAAEEFMRLLKKANPDRDYYITEKEKRERGDPGLIG